MPVQGFVDIIKEEVSTSKRAMFVGEPGLQECVSIYQEDYLSPNVPVLSILHVRLFFKILFKLIFLGHLG
jgi:hypothetical protein